MATATVSAKIDKRTEELADSYIRQAGLTADKLISQLWSNIARTGVVPTFGKARSTRQRDDRRKAFEKAQNIVSNVPKGTKLASISYDDILGNLESGMSKLLIDTNVLIDYVVSDRPEHGNYSLISPKAKTAVM